MVKKLIYLCLVITFPIFSKAQPIEHKIDSINKLLLNNKQDTTRCKNLVALGLLYQISEPAKALKIFHESLDLSKKLNFDKGEGSALYYIGDVYIKMGSYPKALDFLLQSLKIFEEINNRMAIAATLSTIGLTYGSTFEYDKCISYIHQGYSIAKKIKHQDIELTCLTNLGFFYEQMDQLDSARLYTQQAYDLSVQINDQGAIGTNLTNLGNIYIKMNEPVIAMEFYKSTFKYLENIESRFILSEVYLGMARINQAISRSDSILFYGKMALQMATEVGYNEFKSTIIDFLAQYFKSEHQYDSAFAYLELSIAAKDSLYSQEKSRRIYALTFEESIRQQELADAAAAIALERKHKIQYALLAIGIVSCIILYLLLSSSIIINEKWVEFLGVIVLLIVFEFINLLIHPYLTDFTNHSPAGMLLIMVFIATILVPLHHRIERWVNVKLIVKNKEIRLSMAKKIIRRLEGDHPA